MSTETVMERLSLGNKIFADTRIKLDTALNMLIKTLVEKQLAEGSISLRIKTELKTQVTDDGEVVYVPEFEPKVSIKVGASGSMDCVVPKGLIMKRSQDGANIVCENQISMDELAKEKKGA